MKHKILFFINSLQGGGAEKVLVNLVNNMDSTLFDVTLVTLFGGGVNEKFLNDSVNYKCCFKKPFKGNSAFFKLFSPQKLHKMFIHEEYDIEVAYLEGVAARIIGGCPNKKTKLLSWIHIEQHTLKRAIEDFRNEDEARKIYTRFDKIVCVSKGVKADFSSVFDSYYDSEIVYNTIDSKSIIQKSTEKVDEFSDSGLNVIVCGKLTETKGIKRLLEIHKNLNNKGYSFNLYFLGDGPLKKDAENYIRENSFGKSVHLLGYRENPYKFIKSSDLLLCGSYAEGFSTVVVEALVVGTPVCTVEVSGMKELLGENNEYGIVVENDTTKLQDALENILNDPIILSNYSKKAKERGQMFVTEKTVSETQELFIKVLESNN